MVTMSMSQIICTHSAYVHVKASIPYTMSVVVSARKVLTPLGHSGTSVISVVICISSQHGQVLEFLKHATGSAFPEHSV